MPVCTHCAALVSSLWTVYSSASNIRLTLCDACHAFADPYVEQPPLLLFLDLVLLKPGVYRHLLFNRGTEPVQAGRAATEGKTASRGEGRWKTVKQLLVGLAASTVVADTYLRWTALAADSASPSPSQDVKAFMSLLLSVILETSLFHLTVLLSTLALLYLRRKLFSPQLRPPPNAATSLRPPTDDFHPSLIPLTLLLSSLPKLLLLLLLSIWPTPSLPSATPLTPPFPLPAFLTQILEQETLDREWVVRNVLGGMGVGFGLRVLLMGRVSAVESTGVVCLGWAVGRWVGLGGGLGEVRGGGGG